MIVRIGIARLSGAITLAAALSAGGVAVGAPTDGPYADPAVPYPGAASEASVLATAVPDMPAVHPANANETWDPEDLAAAYRSGLTVGSFSLADGSPVEGMPIDLNVKRPAGSGSGALRQGAVFPTPGTLPARLGRGGGAAGGGSEPDRAMRSAAGPISFIGVPTAYAFVSTETPGERPVGDAKASTSPPRPRRVAVAEPAGILPFMSGVGALIWLHFRRRVRARA